MNTYRQEMKSFWNRTVMLLISLIVLCAYYIAMAHPLIQGYIDAPIMDPYLEYQVEMFEKYGDTLEPEEFIDFDFQGKIDACIQEANEIIRLNPVFEKHNIQSYEDYLENQNDPDLYNTEIVNLIWGLSDVRIGPSQRIDALSTLRYRYTPYSERTEDVGMHYQGPNIAFGDTSSVLYQKTISCRDQYGNNLIRVDLPSTFSMYMCQTGIAILLSMAIFISSYIAKSLQIHTQKNAGSSNEVSRFEGKQAVVIILSTVLLTPLILFISAVFFIGRTDTFSYLTANIAAYERVFFMYNIPLLVYLLLQGMMIIVINSGMAALLFFLGKTADSINTLTARSIILTLLMAFLMYLCTNKAMSDENFLFTNLFSHKVELPEMILTFIIGIVGLGSLFLLYRKQKAQLRDELK